jgi:hypothetical protein
VRPCGGIEQEILPPSAASAARSYASPSDQAADETRLGGFGIGVEILRVIARGIGDDVVLRDAGCASTRFAGTKSSKYDIEARPSL